MTAVEGGEHHTICCTDQGRVYCWGRNDESQCGAGDLYDPYKREEQRQKAEAEAKILEESKEKPEEEIPLTQSAQKSRKKKQPLEKEPDLDGIAYFLRPKLVEGLLVDKSVSRVAAGSNYCYALV